MLWLNDAVASSLLWPIVGQFIEPALILVKSVGMEVKAVRLGLDGIEHAQGNVHICDVG